MLYHTFDHLFADNKGVLLMVNFILSLKPCFTDADKEACKPVITRVMELAAIARKEGLLMLEDQIKEEDSFFLKMAIELVVDAVEPDSVKEILQKLILADDYSGVELLSRLLITEGALAIQNGDNPPLLKEKLTAMLGEKYLLQTKITQEAEKEAAKIKTAQQVKQFLGKKKGQEGLPECRTLELFMTRMPDRSVQRVLMDADLRDLACALKGCSYPLIQKIFDNLSAELYVTTADEMNYLWNVRIIDVEEAQWRIVKIIELLDESGEIALR